MKEFHKTQKVTYNLMSFTGFKALIVFTMLAESPKSYEEISSAIENHPYLREKISIDTMRVYINSLKRIGCEIKRTKGEDKISRYYISENPFELKITPEQSNTILKIYKTIIKDMDVKDIIFMTNFLNKIEKYVEDKNFINSIKNISMLKDINMEILTKLVECCDRKNCIVVKYRSPNSGEKNIEIQTNNIQISNYKIYLNGFGYEYNQNTSFPVSRIKEIIEIKEPNKNLLNEQTLKVQYEIKKDNFTKNDNEKILKEFANKYLVEASTTNKFYLKQRLLEFGPDCKIIAPNDFKSEFIELLKNMKAGYING